jgi:hypothetical protein
MAIQEKTRSYVKWIPNNDFIFLTIDMYGCFHSCFDSFILFVHKPLWRVINSFLSPLNACFLLSTTHVHSPITCASHCNSSMGCYIWSRFFIFFTHHNWCTFDINQFVVDDNSFILGLFCDYWLSFPGHESSLHSIFLTNFCWSVAFVFFFVLCLLVSSFALYFWWMGSHHWFLFTRFFFYFISVLMMCLLLCSLVTCSLTFICLILLVDGFPSLLFFIYRVFLLIILREKL